LLSAPVALQLVTFVVPDLNGGPRCTKTQQTDSQKQTIDDGDISCPFPRDVYSLRLPDTNPLITDASFDILLCTVRFARICSKISTLLYSATSLARHPRASFQTVRVLDHELAEWHDNIPYVLRLNRPMRRCELPKDETFVQALILHFSYEFAICAVHGRITTQFSWDRTDDGQDALGKQASDAPHLEYSAGLCLKAARSMILLTRYIDVDNSTPSW
jgi:hypothetical protein